MASILNYFPDKLQKKIAEEILDKMEDLEEIRIRVNRPIILKFNKIEKIIKYSVLTEEILSSLQLICENSIYSYQNQISEGFITIKGGHRVGITGSCVIENGKIININYIYSLNFRIAKEVIGCANTVLKYILKPEDNNVYNTIIVSAPGSGKTTLLRDIIRQVSSGIKDIKFKAINVGVVDERSEICAMYKGMPQKDVGIKTDIIENVSKDVGIKMLVRTMTPKIIAADEIGNENDITAINYAICSGCKGIFTAHGTSFEELYLNPIIKSLINNHIFERIIFLDNFKKGKISKIYSINKENGEYEEMEI